MAFLRVPTADAPRFPELNRVLAESLNRKDFSAAFERWRSQGRMEFENAALIASLFVAMAQGEWPTRLSYGLVKGMTEQEIEAHAKFATRLFLKAVAP